MARNCSDVTVNKANKNRHCPQSFFHTMSFAEVAVFVETNLGTRIVMTVPLDITAGDFKRKLEKTHGSCFSSTGEIRVNRLMVKRKDHFYYLAVTVPLKCIFLDNQKPWLIHAEARVVSGSQEPNTSNSIDEAQIRHFPASDKSIEGVSTLIQGENKKIKKSRAKPESTNFESERTCVEKRELRGPSTSEPETIRSSFTIQRAAEMEDSESFNSVEPKTPDRKPIKSVSVSEMISKKLTVAANNIRMQGRTHNSPSVLSSIFRSKTCRNKCLDRKTVTSVAKFLVFEIPDSED